MHTLPSDLSQLLIENLALGRDYGAAQRRCSLLISKQQAEIEALQQQVMRLRAQVMVRDSAAAFASSVRVAHAEVSLTPVEASVALLEASLVAADLVICQTGCLSHGAYWRVQDHCMRTGKHCVVVADPTAVRVVRIHGPGEVMTD